MWLDYTEGAELVDQVLDVTRKEAEGCDCLQGTSKATNSPFTVKFTDLDCRLPSHPLPWWWNWRWYGYTVDLEDP